MRPEEYLSLKWSDLDLEARTVTVTRTLVWRKGGGWYFGEPKTARSRRTITFPEPLGRLLKAHRAKQSEFGKRPPLLAAPAFFAGDDLAARVETILIAQQALDARPQQFLLFRELDIHPISLFADVSFV